MNTRNGVNILMAVIGEFKTDENGLRKTPLYDYYVEKGVNLTDFNGWSLPIQFTSIKEEHDATREAVTLFDTSHMGEIRVKGDDALAFLNGVVSNNVLNIDDNQAIYTAVTNDEGGTLDDLIIFKENQQEVVLTPNSGNFEKIYSWLQDHNNGEVEIDDETSQWGLIAIQGPKAQEVLAKVTETDLDSIKGYHFLQDQTVAGVDGVVISRTGYTGEDGFELYTPWGETQNIWNKLLEAGKDAGIVEAALGARDTLRTEGGMALYGNDLSEEINPVEGGIGFAVKTGDKKEADYPGKQSLTDYKAREDADKRVSRGFELTGKGIARPGFKVLNKDGEEIGEVTTGTQSPTFGTALGYILIDKEEAAFGDEILIQVRKRQVPAVIVKKDWLRR